MCIVSIIWISLPCPVTHINNAMTKELKRTRTKTRFCGGYEKSQFERLSKGMFLDIFVYERFTFFLFRILLTPVDWGLRVYQSWVKMINYFGIMTISLEVGIVNMINVFSTPTPKYSCNVWWKMNRQRAKQQQSAAKHHTKIIKHKNDNL